MNHIAPLYAVAFPAGRPEASQDLPSVDDLFTNIGLRGGAVVRPTVLELGPLSLDLLTRNARRSGRDIELRTREFHLLEYMMRHHGALLTRAALFRDVWNYKFVPRSNLVDVHMGRLRRKIDGLGEPQMIFTVPRQGFILRAPG